MSRRTPTRPKLTVATTFPVHPARGGGQARVLGLYGAVAALGVDVDLVTLGAHGERPVTTALRPGLREIRVAKTAAHEEAERALQAELGGVPVTDVALALFHALTPAYAAAVRASAADASAVVACHPYAAPLLLDAAPGIPLLYEAQDVELDVKAGILDSPDLLEVVREHEALACGEAVHVFTCADEDARRLGELYALPAERRATVPNGYDPERVRHTPWVERAAARRSVGLDRFTVLFVGSWHGPNIDAARAVMTAVDGLPEVHAMVVGSAGSALDGEPVPANVDVTGAVPDGFLQAVLALADVAVNPMVSGSGTNLKMLEYAGAGVPLVSSGFGARGLGLVPGEHYVAAEPGELGAALLAVRDEPEVNARRAGRAHDHVRATFAWDRIALDWLARAPVRDLLGRA